MKHLLIGILLLSVFSISFAQKKKHEKKDSTEITAWEQINFATTEWDEVRHIFIPADIMKDTLLIETLNIVQHRKHFKKRQKEYYESKGIDTMSARFKTEIPLFLENQKSETNYILTNYKGKAKEVNEANVVNQNLETCRYVLKKTIKIHSLNPHTSHGIAYIEYFIYDRKERKQYPHMSTDLEWLMTHLNLP